VSWFLRDLPRRWGDRRVLIVGHVAMRWGLDREIHGIPLKTSVEQEFR
jgi:hypothetical protein